MTLPCINVSGTAENVKYFLFMVYDSCGPHCHPGIEDEHFGFELGFIHSIALMCRNGDEQIIKNINFNDCEYSDRCTAGGIQRIFNAMMNIATACTDTPVVVELVV